MKRIDSKENQIYKDLLKKKNKMNKSSSEFFIEGIRMVNEAINQKKEISKIIFSSSEYEKYSDEFNNQSHNTIILDDKLFGLLSSDTTPSGIMALINIDKNNFSTSDRILYLDDIQDPGNAGALIRSGVACGFDTIVFSNNSVNPYSYKVLKSTMGTFFKANILINKSIDDFKGYLIISADLDGENIFKIDFNNDKYILVVGNEGNGISNSLKGKVNTVVSIPMINNVESLNVAIAGSIIMYQISKNYL
jgi:TrmH family RNA methyltransferase